MKAVILCGGKGIRLRPVTDKIPKPLIYIKGKPIIQHILDYYVQAGFENFIFCIGYRGEMIKEYFKKRRYNIEYVDSGEEAPILKRIYDARNLVSDRFMVSYGDTIANIDFKKLLEFHENKGLVTLTTYKMQSPFGLVFSDSAGVVKKFKEKPYLNYWMNIGYMVFEKEAFNYMTEDMLEKEDGLITFFNELISRKLLYSYKHRGSHITVNTEKERELAEKNIHKLYTYIGGGQ